MHLEFYGAAGGVTGSCHILRMGSHTLLLDCGMIQGGRRDEARNRDPFPFDPAEIDAVVLSHAHLDHSGRLPLLVRQGFRGPVYTGNATRDLCRILLADAASLAARDAEYANRKRRQSDDPVEPLFTHKDAETAISQMAGMPYRQPREILPGLTLVFHDAGHILGSGIVDLSYRSGDGSHRLVFTGDLGQYDTPILHDPALIEQADTVIMECTYGDRLHRDREQTIREIGDIITAARHDRGNILIPSFAIGRSQELLYLLGKHQAEWELDRWSLFLDSPMAIQATRVYWEYPHLYDEEATKLRRAENPMPLVKNLRLTASVEESMAINRIESGAIIIAGSGMCNGGRIVHHLKHNVWRQGCHVLIPGYQAHGTLGRRIVDGEPSIRIHGRDYAVRATVHTVGGLSAHGDRNDLLRWLSGFRSRPRVFLVHGEPETATAFCETIRQGMGLETQVAAPGMTVDLVPLQSSRR